MKFTEHLKEEDIDSRAARLDRLLKSKVEKPAAVTLKDEPEKNMILESTSTTDVTEIAD